MGLESRDVTALLLLSQQISAYPHFKSVLSKHCGLQHRSLIKSLIHNENISLFAPIGVITISFKRKRKQSTAATILNALSEAELPCLP